MKRATEQRLKKTKAQRAEQARFAHRELRKLIKPRTPIYTVLTHVSSSGMSRRIKVLLIVKRPKAHGGGTEIRDVSAWVSSVLDWKWHDSGAVVVAGCGMDMGFHLADSLMSALYPKGVKPRNDAEKRVAGADGRIRAPHTVNHRWL